MPLEAHLCRDIWNAAAQLPSKISIAANGLSARASFEPFQRTEEPDHFCHLSLCFSLSFTLEWHKIIGKSETCKDALLLKNNGKRVKIGFSVVNT